MGIDSIWLKSNLGPRAILLTGRDHGRPGSFVLASTEGCHPPAHPEKSGRSLTGWIKYFLHE